MLERKSLQSEAISLWLAAIDAAWAILYVRLSNCQGLVTTPRDRSRPPIDDLRSPYIAGFQHRLPVAAPAHFQQGRE
jgi:hypothetical protein